MTATLRTKVWLTARVVKASFINIATAGLQPLFSHCEWGLPRRAWGLPRRRRADSPVGKTGRSGGIAFSSSQLRQSFHEGARGIEFSYGGGVLKGRGSLEAGTVVLSLC